MTDHKKCVLCGGSEADTLYNFGEVDILRCKACGLGFASPIPNTEEILREYDEEYYEVNYSARPSADPALDFGAAVFDKIEEHAAPGNLLDMGCGSGEYIAAAKSRGWACRGIDISAAAAEIARKKTGAEIFNGPLKDAAFETDFFDAVIMIHSLEHQIDPPAVMAEALRIIKPGGVIFISVPNIDGERAAREGASWRGLQPGRHFYFFNESSLSKLAGGAGFRVIESISPESVISGSQINSKLGPAFGGFVRSVVKALLGKRIKNLRRAVLKPSGGESVTLLAVKPRGG